MKPDTIKSWVSRKKKWGCAQHALLSAIALIGGVVVLFLTFWFTYAIVWFGWHGVSAISELLAGKELHLSHEIRLLCSGVFLVLLFVQHFRTDPSHWGDYPKRDYVAAPGLQVQAGILGGLGFMLAYPGASANMVADILLSGPRLVVGAWGQLREAMRLKHMDEAGCADLLAFLSGRPEAVPYEELCSAGWENWLDQLRLIEGVQFLQKGLLLSQELRTEFSGLRGD